MDPEKESREKIGIVVFSGKQEDWRKWLRKFLAQAKFRGFKEVIEGNAEFPDPDDDGGYTKEQQEEIERLDKLNSLAYNALILLVDDEVSLNAVDTAVSEAYPDGRAATAWEKLLLRWQPLTLTTVEI